MSANGTKPKILLKPQMNADKRRKALTAEDTEDTKERHKTKTRNINDENRRADLATS